MLKNDELFYLKLFTEALSRPRNAGKTVSYLREEDARFARQKLYALRKEQSPTYDGLSFKQRGCSVQIINRGITDPIDP